MHTQRGATLVTILILLVIIIIIGTLAIRKSLTSLNIATAAQAQQLMIQSSDAALAEIENPNKFETRNNGGVFYLVRNATTSLIYCYSNSADPFFNQSKCGSQDFSTSRNAVITQVYVENAKVDQEKSSDTSAANSDYDNNVITMQVTAISIIPSLSKTTATTCLSRDTSATAISCLRDNSGQTPYYVSISQYKLNPPLEASTS